MSLRIEFTTTYVGETIVGSYDAVLGRIVITEIYGGHRILEALQKHVARKRYEHLAAATFGRADWDRLIAVAERHRISDGGPDEIYRRFAPLLEQIYISADDIRGLRVGSGQFKLTVDGIDEWFWNDSVKDLVVGTGPYAL